MNTNFKSIGLIFVAVAAALMTGCATSGRYVALQESASPRSAAENSPLKGRVICVTPFVDGFNIDDQLPDKNPQEPAGYTYLKMTSEETSRWDNEVEHLKKTATKNDWPQIGYVRNGYGSVMSKVYALNDPGVWLTEMLKADLQKLGAQVVDPSQAAHAEITVGGTIKFFRIDIHMSYSADLVVDVDFKPRAKASTTRTLHTKAAQLAWSSSSYEYYQPLRQCQQKFSRLLIADLEQFPKDDPSLPAYVEVQKAPEKADPASVENAKAQFPLLSSNEPGEVIRELKRLRSPQYSVAVPAILPLLNRQNPNVVRDSCRTLAVIATKDVIPAIEPLLNNKRADVRKDAQDAIDKLRAKP